MELLADKGRYTVDPAITEKIRDAFCGAFTTEEQTAETIKRVYYSYRYLCDTHTAVALNCAFGHAKKAGGVRVVTASTASPYKFASDVLRSLSGSSPEDKFAALDGLNGLTGAPVPAGLASLRSKKVRFDRVITPEDMLSEVFGEMGVE